MRWPALIAVAVLVAGTAAAGRMDGEYQFKSGIGLDIGTVLDDGLRVDRVTFVLPETSESSSSRTGGVPAADVLLSNTGGARRSVGIAIVLYDPEHRIVGVASAGTRIAGLRAGRQQAYRLVFSDVNMAVSRAVTFGIVVETW